MIDYLFQRGGAVDVILVVIALECAFLYWRSRSGRRPGAPVDLALAVAPGVCLLLALRGALTQASWVWIAAWLALSFPIHVADLLRRRL